MIVLRRILIFLIRWDLHGTQQNALCQNFVTYYIRVTDEFENFRIFVSLFQLLLPTFLFIAKNAFLQSKE